MGKKIREILNRVPEHSYIQVPENACVESVAEEMSKKPGIRISYVVDEEGRLKGTLSLGCLIRNLTAKRHRPRFHKRSIIESITCRRIGDIMERDVLYTRVDDDIENVLDLMLENNIKDIPVLDREGKIISNIGLLDLWRFSGHTG